MYPSGTSGDYLTADEGNAEIRRVVRRFGRDARGDWRFQCAKTQRRMLVPVALAEGVRLGSNGLQAFVGLFGLWNPAAAGAASIYSTVGYHVFEST